MENGRNIKPSAADCIHCHKCRDNCAFLSKYGIDIGDTVKLKELAYQKADSFHSEYILSGANLLEIGLRYVKFAADEPMLFRFLFQSGHFAGLRLEDLLKTPDAAPLLEIASNEEGLTLEEAMSYFEPLYAAVHGYASLIANNGMDYDPAAIRRSLVFLAEAIIGKDE